MELWRASLVVLAVAALSGGCGGGGGGGAGATTGDGGSSGSGTTGGTSLPTCGADGSGVCISADAVSCPIGFNLTQMGCDPGGGVPGSCCLPSGETFACGSKQCDMATQVCVVTNPGCCDADPSYSCAELPSVCQAPGAFCSCFDEAEKCPCNGGPAPCSGGIDAYCLSKEGGFKYNCSYP